MSSSQERDLIIKRGYLTGKGSFLDRRRWFVLRKEAGKCRLDFYKDEKAASKGEQCKGSILMEEVVEVQRTMDKKQTFEILCPGVGHKLTASSDAEADEWVEIMRKLKSYRKERQPEVVGVPYHPNAHQTQMVMSPLHSDVLSQSPSHLTGVGTTSGQFVQSPPPHMHPRPMAIQISSQPISVSNNGHPVKRQVSGDSTGAFPSPSTNSSDSSPEMVGSTSTTSFDQSPATEETSEPRTRYPVKLKESEKLQMGGSCDLVVSEDSITLYSVNSDQQLVSWPIRSLRRYGLSNWCFSIDAGRGCYTGEGTFFFYTDHSKAIYYRVHKLAQQYKKSQQLAIEGTSPQALTSPKHLSHHDSTSMGSPTNHSFYSTLSHNYGELPTAVDHQSVCHAHSGMHIPQQRHAHQPQPAGTGNVFICPPQTTPISIPNSMMSTQPHIVFSQHGSPGCAGVCHHCSVGLQRATPPSTFPYGFQRSMSSDEAMTTFCYYTTDSGKKRSQSLAGPPNQ